MRLDSFLEMEVRFGSAKQKLLKERIDLLMQLKGGGVRARDQIYHEDGIEAPDWRTFCNAIVDATNVDVTTIETLVRAAARKVASADSTGPWRKFQYKVPAGKRIRFDNGAIFSQVVLPVMLRESLLRHGHYYPPDDDLPFISFIERGGLRIGPGCTSNAPLREFIMWSTFNHSKPSVPSEILPTRAVTLDIKKYKKRHILASLGLNNTWTSKTLLILHYGLPRNVDPVKPTVMHSLSGGDLNYYYRTHHGASATDCGWTCPWPNSNGLAQPEVVHAPAEFKNVIEIYAPCVLR